MRSPSASKIAILVAALLALTALAGGCESMGDGISRSLGVTSLGTSTVRQTQVMGRSYNDYHAAPSSGESSMPSTPAVGLPPSGTTAAHAPAGVVRAQADDTLSGPDIGGGPGASSAGRPDPARQMIYSARFEISTPNVDDAMNRFTRAVESTGGYLDCREDSHVLCRIPAARFHDFVATIPAFGSILSQTIRNEDVTRKYQDLGLRIETAEWSRRRVLGLLERAEAIEDVLKLEAELMKLTATIEGLKGTMRDLSEQIAYSKVAVFFRARTPELVAGRTETASPFAWINRIGPDQVMAGFGSVDRTEKPSMIDASALMPGGLSVGPLEGFLLVKRDRAELKAITPDASKLWVREFAVPQRGSLDFWFKAVKNDMLDHRGYVLVEEQRVHDGKGNEGVEMIFDVVVQGQAHRYLVAVYALGSPLWRVNNTVRTVEFTAPAATFDKYQAAVRRSLGGS